MEIALFGKEKLNSSINFQELISGFDQETSAVILARMVSLRMETEVTTAISKIVILGFRFVILTPEDEWMKKTPLSILIFAISLNG